MRLLIITQILDSNDPALGFVHEWVREFSKNVESLTVIALKVGDYQMPPHVRVVTLGKERGVGRVVYVLRLIREVVFKSGSYDSVFVHMNPEYLVLFGLWWRLSQKQTVLWYAHRLVDLKLRIGTFFANRVATASPESFRLRTKKLSVVGHGIPLEQIHFSMHTPLIPYKLISIGRITESKQCEVLIRTLNPIRRAGYTIELTFVGAGITSEDIEYRKWLQNEVTKEGLENFVHFTGGLPHSVMSTALEGADCFVSASMTGGLDKAVLEAMASGTPVITSNSGLYTTLKDHPELLFQDGNVAECTERIIRIITLTKEGRVALCRDLRTIVEQNHSLSKLIPNLIKLLQ